MLHVSRFVDDQAQQSGKDDIKGERGELTSLERKEAKEADRLSSRSKTEELLEQDEERAEKRRALAPLFKGDHIPDFLAGSDFLYFDEPEKVLATLKEEALVCVNKFVQSDRMQKYVDLRERQQHSLSKSPAGTFYANLSSAVVEGDSTERKDVQLDYMQAKEFLSRFFDVFNVRMRLTQEKINERHISADRKPISLFDRLFDSAWSTFQAVCLENFTAVRYTPPSVKEPSLHTLKYTCTHGIRPDTDRGRQDVEWQLTFDTKTESVIMDCEGLKKCFNLSKKQLSAVVSPLLVSGNLAKWRRANGDLVNLDRLIAMIISSGVLLFGMIKDLNPPTTKRREDVEDDNDETLGDFIVDDDEELEYEKDEDEEKHGKRKREDDNDEDEESDEDYTGETEDSKEEEEEDDSEKEKPKQPSTKKEVVDLTPITPSSSSSSSSVSSSPLVKSAMIQPTASKNKAKRFHLLD